MITAVAKSAGHVAIRQPVELLDAIAAGDVEPRSLSPQDEHALRRWCRWRTRASACAIQRLAERGHMKNARREARGHIQCREVLLDALFCSARKRWPSASAMSSEQLEDRRRFRLSMAFGQLAKVGNFRRSARAHQFARQKKSGGERIITSFHWVDRARQRVLKSALTPFANLHASQFMQARDPERRGLAAVRNALLSALADCGEDSVFMQFDVRDFYPSISHEWLESNLGIEPAIVSRQVHTGGMKIVPIGGMAKVRGLHEARREDDRWGIPQGSALSSLIADQVMAAVIRSAAIFEELPTFVWSDNIGVIVPRGREGAVEGLVRAAFADHGAGSFQLTVTRQPVRKFKFLGIWYRTTATGPEAIVPWEALLAWEIKIGSKLLHCSDFELEQIELEVRRELIRLRWCPAVSEIGSRLSEMIESRRASPVALPRRMAA